MTSQASRRKGGVGKGGGEARLEAARDRQLSYLRRLP